MSHIRIKTTYKGEGAYVSVEERTIFAHHNNSCDVITFYGEEGEVLFSVEDTMKDNLLDAINRLSAPCKINSFDLDEGIEYMNEKDKKICKM